MKENSLKQKTKTGLYWKFFEQCSTYGMQFVVGIIMARLLTPSDFGITAIPTIFITIAQVFIEGSFGLALIRKKEVTESDLSTAFFYSVGIGILLYILIFFAAPYIAGFYEIPVLTPLIRVTAVIFIWNPLNTPQMVLLNRKLDFKTPAKISIMNKLVSAILGISTAYMGYGLWALVISSLSASFFGVLQTWMAVRWVPRKCFSIESFRYLWDFGNKLMGANLLNTLYANIVPIIVGKTSGTYDLGNLNRARQFASLPSANFTGALNSVTFPVLSKIQDDDELFAKQYRRIIKVSSFIVFPVMMILSALAHPLVVSLLTEKWSGCIILLEIMCFTYMFQPVQILNLNLLEIKGRTDLSLKLEIVKKILFTIAILLAVQYGLIILCVVDFFLTMIALFFNTYYTGKLINVGYLKQVKDFLPSLILSIIVMLAVRLICMLLDSNVMALFWGTLIGISLYYGLAWILNFEEIEDVKYLIKINR